MKKNFVLLIIVSLILGGIYLGNNNFFGHKEVSGYLEEEINDKEVEIFEPPIQSSVKTISILGVGDIMFHMPQIVSANLDDGGYDFNPPFKYVKKYIEEADIALANFETVTAGNAKGFSGFPRFNSPMETVYALKQTGFDILSTANNHCLDGGKSGIISTIENIENNGLKNIGTYKDNNKSLLIEEVEGIKIGFLSYTLGTNGLDNLLTSDELEYMIDRVDEKKIREDIDTLKDAQVDLILSYIHWGREYQNKPNSYQEDLGKKMVEWGANIILGSHPHVVQRAEILKLNDKDNYIVYSMGNFYSNQRYETIGNPYTEDSVMVKFIIEKNLDTNDTIIKDAIFIPTWIYRYVENKQIKYLILPIGSSEAISSEVSEELSDKTIERIKKSYEDTMNTLGGCHLERSREISGFKRGDSSGAVFKGWTQNDTSSKSGFRL